ncbi:uncharacterized protein LOC143919826 [Arctopsyche grandis]|uniref:uncharacterized protein LOC143919826 n=1 Tax=Arctopsyche grandis TaxID=121162 RepID=UPI00406D7F50
MPPSPPTPPERERERQRDRDRERDRDRDRDRDRHQSASTSASASTAAAAAAPSTASASAPVAVAPAAPASAPHEILCEDSGQLENLNEKQLRALLDEAVTYKRPKDREGKSSLFKNLLYKAEQASEEELQLACSSIGSIGANCGKRGRAKRSLTHFPHSGSLQDLAGAGSGADARLPRPHARHRRPVPVSARSLHGGSLPANVDQQYFGTFLEDVRCGTSGGIKPRISGNDYIATVKCINPPPLGEPPNPDYMVLSVATDESDRVSSPPVQHPTASSPQPTYISGYFDDDEGTEMDYIRPQKNSHIPSYTSRTTLEIVSPSMSGEAAVTDRSSNALNLVDSNHGCITSPAVTQTPPSSVLETKPLQLPSSYCAVRSVTGPTSIDGNSPTNSATSNAFPVIPNTHLNVINILQSQSHQFQHESDKKNFDENYNAVQNIGSITGTSQPNQKNQKKRKKLYKNETQTLAELIDGYRGDEKLDDIIKFIESDADNVKHHGKNQSKSNTGIGINGKVTINKSKDDNDHDKSSKKRSTERRVKDKLETKLKRANSMEELSRRKFDDLTSPKDSLSFRKTKKTCVFESASVSNGKNNERRSWCSDESEPYCKTDNRNNDSDDRTTPTDLIASTSSISMTKQKKSKASPAELDISIIDYDPFYAIETSDFQTVTKKKKIRKRHSPSDEGRNRPNFYAHNVQNMRPSNGGRSNQERDTLYKRFGNGAHPSVSSPPSDKSNDSNDDLDSVHSLPADASGERFQASYADMARAAPPVSPPPSAPPVSRQHNFPDLIESCNYYTNDVTIQDKHFDISVENTKNLLLKENSNDYDKTKSIKANCLDLGNQPDLNIHKTYIREQYPALESRQKMCNKITVKSKVDNKFQNHKMYNEKQGDESTKPFDSKSKDETVTSGSVATVSGDDANCISEQYVDYRAVNSVAENVLNSNTFANAKPNKINHSNNKIDNPSKPPDVVLPLAAEINQSFESRPPVIIMNEEPNRSSDDIQNMNGITFGFDINEQLINGEIAQGSDTVEYSDSTNNNNNVRVNDSPPSTVVYNSNIDFPAINEKPFRESSDKSKVVSDDSKHSKKSSRATVKDGIKFVSKSNCSDAADPPCCPKTEDANDTSKDKVIQGEGQVVETCVGGDKALRYLAPTATSKDIYNLDRIVHYVGMAWENIIKSSSDKIRYFSDQQ